MLLQDLPIDAIALLGFFVDTGSANECNPAITVVIDEVRHGVAHAFGIVHEYTRDSLQGDTDAAHG